MLFVSSERLSGPHISWTTLADYLRKIIVQGRSSKTTNVGDIMTEEVRLPALSDAHMLPHHSVKFSAVPSMHCCPCMLLLSIVGRTFSHLLVFPPGSHSHHIVSVAQNKLITVTPDTRVLTAMDLMTRKQHSCRTPGTKHWFFRYRKTFDLWRKFLHSSHVRLCKLTENRIRHIPVCEDRKMKGMVSIGDVVRAVVEEHKMEVNRLNDYIKGSYWQNLVQVITWPGSGLYYSA